MWELEILFVFMIIGALIAVEVKNILSSIIAMGVVGLGLSLVFLILKAPDLAIVQLVVELLALIILLRATVKRDLNEREPRVNILTISLSSIFLLIFLFFAYTCFNNLPRFGFPIMKVARTYIQEGLQKTGATNIVSAIILDYRGYDTLGAMTILFTTVVGALTVLRTVGRKKGE